MHEKYSWEGIKFEIVFEDSQGNPLDAENMVFRFIYRDEAGQLTWREVQPLGLFFWGEHWLLAAWCERRDDYRCFRLDRCLHITLTERRFSESADRSLADFLRKVKQ